jgi:branched-chain amino acid transport system substrate-binding protein
VPAVLIVCALSGVIAGCGSSGSSGGSSTAASAKQPAAKTSCPVNVLIVTQMTGSAGANGQGGAPAAQVAANEINKSGGVLGCPIKIDTKDDESDATKDLPLTQAALSHKHYADVFLSSFGVASVVPYLMRQKQLTISAFGSLGNDPSTYPYYFDVAPSNASILPYAVKQAVNDHHTKIAAIIQNNALGNSSVAIMTAAAKQDGGRIVDVERVDATAVDFTAAVVRAKQSNPDALIFDVYGPTAASLIKTVKAQGWNVALYGGDAVFATNIASLVPKSAYENLVVTGPTMGTRPSRPVVSKVIAELKAANATATFKANLALGGQFHDGLIVFAWAANQTKSLDPAVIKQFLETHGNTPVPGLMLATNTGFDSQSHQQLGTGSVSAAKEGPLVDGTLARIGAPLR